MAAGGEASVVVELHQAVRVISKNAKCELISHEEGSRAVVITAAGEGGPLPCAGSGAGVGIPVAQTGGGDGKNWLVAITDDGNERLKSVQTRKKPRIQRVQSFLRHGNAPFFEPEVVSLGPYYHGQPRFAAMEENKWAAAARFAGEQGVSAFYDRVSSVAGAARECYADELDGVCGEEDFVKMMFFDGCFVLHFIDCCMDADGNTSPTTKAHLRGFITRDMFLLENQVPFVVLQALMRLRPVRYKEFVRKITGDTSMTPPSAAAAAAGPGSSTATAVVDGWKRWWGYSDQAPAATERGGGAAEEDPAHLLDLLRTELLGGEQQQPPRRLVPRPLHEAADWQSFRSVMELREVGIKFGKSRSSCLLDVEFTEGLVYGRLHLPPMVVDDMVRPKFLNLVALEMCPDGDCDYGVTSYICFLDSLIDHADDVKELRRGRILLNGLGSDQQVADLFNELTTGLSPEHFAYGDTIARINQHCGNKNKVSFARMYHTHFGSPWTTISFLAAVFLILLTTAQTFFAVFPKFAKDKS